MVLLQLGYQEPRLPSSVCAGLLNKTTLVLIVRCTLVIIRRRPEC